MTTASTRKRQHLLGVITFFVVALASCARVDQGNGSGKMPRGPDAAPGDAGPVASDASVAGDRPAESATCRPA